MKQFEVTMSAVSKKTFTVQANTQDEALSMVDTIFENTDLLDFDEDMDSVEISCTEQCGGVCEVCSNYCELCGSCSS